MLPYLHAGLVHIPEYQSMSVFMVRAAALMTRMDSHFASMDR